MRIIGKISIAEKKKSLSPLLSLSVLSMYIVSLSLSLHLSLSHTHTHLSIPLVDREKAMTFSPRTYFLPSPANPNSKFLEVADGASNNGFVFFSAPLSRVADSGLAAKRGSGHKLRLPRFTNPIISNDLYQVCA